MSVNINRPHEVRLVRWRNSTESDPVNLLPGAAWNLYIPDGFNGSQVTILAYVERDINDPETSEGPVKAFRPYDNGVLAVQEDQMHDLTNNNLFGLSQVVFKSDAVETCTGEVSLTS